jgi:hypothetical protein
MSKETKQELIKILTAQNYILEADLNKSEKMWENGEERAKIIGYLQGALKTSIIYNNELLDRLK